MRQRNLSRMLAGHPSLSPSGRMSVRTV
jgi:hypothetical protein